MARQGGLGKGLVSLIPADVLASAGGAADGPRLEELPITAIRPNPHQPRQHFDEETLTELAASITELGVLQPVLVGRRADISPPIVLLGLWIGGWLWGVAGVALATPILVSAKVAAQEFLRAERDAKAEDRAETVRARASEWLKRNAGRYRRDRLMPP